LTSHAWGWKGQSAGSPKEGGWVEKRTVLRTELGATSSERQGGRERSAREVRADAIPGHPALQHSQGLWHAVLSLQQVCFSERSCTHLDERTPQEEWSVVKTV
jgi:hypothetical protein